MSSTRGGDEADAASSDASDSPHVVYVDDDRALLMLVKRALERRGLRVSAYSNGQAALDALRSVEHVDLVMADCSMPGLSGIDLAAALHKLRPDWPVVISSGFVSAAMRAGALAAGVADVVDKPTDIKQLCDYVERALAHA